MGVWDHLEDFETLARLLLHPGQSRVTEVIEALLRDVRGAAGRDGLREVQTELLGYLLDAERRFSEAKRRSLKSKLAADEMDLTFWRRACIQLRTVGDAIAWKFLAYDRRMIVLMRRGNHAGHFHGKAGTDVEWALFNSHWDAGEPTLLTGLTMCLRHGDLLVDRGSGVLDVIEAKSDIDRSRSRQNRRNRELVEMLNREPRYHGPDGPSWIVNTEVRLRTHWPEAVDALDRTASDGAASFVPHVGLGILFIAPGPLLMPGRQVAEGTLARAREEAVGPMGGPGEGQHRVIFHGTNYPYRAGAVAPLSILPIPIRHVARLITGDVTFTIELHPHRLAEAMRRRSFKAEVALPDSDGTLGNTLDVVRFTQGRGAGVMHGSGIEPLALELQDFDVWAQALEETFAPRRDRRFGVYVCFREDDVWA